MSTQTQTDPERSEEAQAPTTPDNDLTLQMLDIARSLGRLEGASQNFATKADVAEAEQRMSEKISATEQRMSEKISAVAADVADVRIEVAEVRTEIAEVRAEVAEAEQRMSEKISAVAAEVAQVESRLIKWIVGTGVVLFIGLGGLLFALLQWLISTLP